MASRLEHGGDLRHPVQHNRRSRHRGTGPSISFKYCMPIFFKMLQAHEDNAQSHLKPVEDSECLLELDARMTYNIGSILLEVFRFMTREPTGFSDMSDMSGRAGRLSIMLAHEKFSLKIQRAILPRLAPLHQCGAAWRLVQVAHHHYSMFVYHPDHLQKAPA